MSYGFGKRDREDELASLNEPFTKNRDLEPNFRDKESVTELEFADVQIDFADGTVLYANASRMVKYTSLRMLIRVCKDHGDEIKIVEDCDPTVFNLVLAHMYGFGKYYEKVLADWVNNDLGKFSKYLELVDKYNLQDHVCNIHFLFTKNLWTSMDINLYSIIKQRSKLGKRVLFKHIGITLEEQFWNRLSSKIRNTVNNDSDISTLVPNVDFDDADLYIRVNFESFKIANIDYYLCYMCFNQAILDNTEFAQRIKWHLISRQDIAKFAISTKIAMRSPTLMNYLLGVMAK